VTISPSSSLLRRRVNHVKAMERYLVGHSKVVDPRRWKSSGSESKSRGDLSPAIEKR